MLKRVWILASLEPKLFCSVAKDEGLFPSKRAGAGTKGRGRSCSPAIYATIIVKRPKRSRATPPHRQNQPDVALLTSDCQSETGDYKDWVNICQAHGTVIGDLIGLGILSVPNQPPDRNLPEAAGTY